MSLHFDFEDCSTDEEIMMQTPAENENCPNSDKMSATKKIANSKNLKDLKDSKNSNESQSAANLSHSSAAKQSKNLRPQPKLHVDSAHSSDSDDEEIPDSIRAQYNRDCLLIKMSAETTNMHMNFDRIFQMLCQFGSNIGSMQNQLLVLKKMADEAAEHRNKTACRVCKCEQFDTLHGLDQIKNKDTRSSKHKDTNSSSHTSDCSDSSNSSSSEIDLANESNKFKKSNKNDIDKTKYSPMSIDSPQSENMESRQNSVKIGSKKTTQRKPLFGENKVALNASQNNIIKAMTYKTLLASESESSSEDESDHKIQTKAKPKVSKQFVKQKKTLNFKSKYSSDSSSSSKSSSSVMPVSTHQHFFNKKESTHFFDEENDPTNCNDQPFPEDMTKLPAFNLTSKKVSAAIETDEYSIENLEELGEFVFEIIQDRNNEPTYFYRNQNFWINNGIDGVRRDNGCKHLFALVHPIVAQYLKKKNGNLNKEWVKQVQHMSTDQFAEVVKNTLVEKDAENYNIR